jgi:hypothetical protein
MNCMQRYVVFLLVSAQNLSVLSFSPECIQLKKDLDDLRAEQWAVPKDSPGMMAELDRIKAATKEKLSQFMSHWPEIKEEFDRGCELMYKRKQAAVRDCCAKMNCQIFQDKKAPNDAKMAAKNLFDRCKANTLTSRGVARFKECADFVQPMFEAAMQLGNTEILKELKPYTLKYWSK